MAPPSPTLLTSTGLNAPLQPGVVQRIWFTCLMNLSNWFKSVKQMFDETIAIYFYTLTFLWGVGTYREPSWLHCHVETVNLFITRHRMDVHAMKSSMDDRRWWVNIASSPGSPIFSTHARKEGEPGRPNHVIHVIYNEHRCFLRMN